jgi:hypothetical protein
LDEIKATLGEVFGIELPKDAGLDEVLRKVVGNIGGS